MTPTDMPRSNVESASAFIPTPERVSQFLELKHEEVSEKMKSVEGRRELFDRLLEHEEDLKQAHPDFDPSALRDDLDIVGQTLQEKERFLKAAEEPQKKGMFRRAFDRVKGFAKRHPVVTTLVGLAAVAAAVAGGFYLAGRWELLMTSTGLSRVLGGAEAAGELLPPTPSTPPLPGAGTFDIPAPVSPPDLGTAT